MYYVRSNGKTIALNGKEEYFFKCSGCRKLIFMGGDEFFEWHAEADIYEISAMYCSRTCSKRSKLAVVK